MNGNPIARVALILLFLGALAWPVWSLTRERVEITPTVQPSSEGEKFVTVDLSLTSSSPATVEVRYAGTFTSKSETAVVVSKEISLPAGEKIDLVIKGVWPTNPTPQALRVMISRDGEDLADKTFWGIEGIEDVVSFTAPQP